MRGAYYYLGVGTGSVIGGRVIRAHGYEFLYELGASAMIIWAAVWAVLLAFASRHNWHGDFFVVADLLTLGGDVIDVADLLTLGGDFIAVDVCRGYTGFL